MSTALNIIATLCFITAFVLYAIRIVKSYKRNGKKEGLFAKGNWKLWWIGSAFLVVGIVCHSTASHMSPNNDEARQQAATMRALGG